VTVNSSSDLVVRCPLCDGPARLAFVAHDRNQGISDEPFRYARCSRCAALHLVDRPADLGRFYPEGYYELPSRTDLERMAQTERYKLAFLREHVGAGSVVEVGPGFGVFALLAKQAGYDYTAIEMDERCCRYLRSEVGVEAIQSDRPADVLAARPPSDAIALWHVLEHLENPWEFLEAAAGNLAPGGILIAAMPNPDAWQFARTGAHWPHVDAPRHLYLIPSSTLEARAAELGLETATVTTRDPGGRGWDKFGWQHLLMRPGQSRARSAAARVAGASVALALAPLERREGKGATYTAVLRKTNAGPTI
jgi:SAM-dependent methyltransferase